MSLNLLGNLEYRNGSSEHEVFINCVFCAKERGHADEDFKLGINLSSGLFHCFKCGASNRNHTLKVLENLEFYGDNHSPINDLTDKLKQVYKKPEFAVDIDEFSVPVCEEETPMSYIYLTQKRKFTDQMIADNNIRSGIPFRAVTKQGEEYMSKKWCGRVVFPFFESGVCKYAVGRSYGDKEPRYYNTANGKGKFIYGLDKVVDGKAILCEGIISSLAAEKHSGITGISTLGKYATEVQMTKIRTKVSKIYLCLDGDVTIEDRKRLRSQAKEFKFPKIYEIFMPKDCDPDDTTTEVFLECLRKAVDISSNSL